MIQIEKELLDRYKTHDAILELLRKNTEQNDSTFTTHRWLVDSLPKRMIFYYLYGDLLSHGKNPQKILDVGGGYSSLTRLLVKNHEYTLLDIMVQDDHDSLRAIENSCGKHFWIDSDWYEYEAVDEYDIIIANDLFPNVDQRLDLFIKKYLPRCNEIRLSLTYYNTPRYYTVKRLDADEILYIQAWDGAQVRRVLEEYILCIDEPGLELLLKNPSSLFANNRQVSLVTLHGKRHGNRA